MIHAHQDCPLVIMMIGIINGLIIAIMIIKIVVMVILLLPVTRYVTGLLHERELALRREQQGLHPWSVVNIATNCHQNNQNQLSLKLSYFDIEIATIVIT